MIQATLELRPRDFQEAKYGPFKLRILPHASRTFQAISHRVLARPCVARDGSQARAYRWYALATVRSLKLHFTEGDDFRPFEHP